MWRWSSDGGSGRKGCDLVLVSVSTSALDPKRRARRSLLIADQSCMLPCVCVCVFTLLCCFSFGHADVMSNGNTLTASCSMFGAAGPPRSPMGRVWPSDPWLPASGTDAPHVTDPLKTESLTDAAAEVSYLFQLIFPIDRPPLGRL